MRGSNSLLATLVRRRDPGQVPGKTSRLDRAPRMAMGADFSHAPRQRLRSNFGGRNETTDISSSQLDRWRTPPSLTSDVSRERARLAASNRGRRDRACLPPPLHPFRHARRIDAQRLANRSDRLARLKPRQSAFAQILRIRSRHPPSLPTRTLNQSRNDSRIPIPSENRTL
jgi:hypothetical protein